MIIAPRNQLTINRSILEYIHNTRFDWSADAVVAASDLTRKAVGSNLTQEKNWYEIQIIFADPDACPCEIYVRKQPL